MEIVDKCRICGKEFRVKSSNIYCDIFWSRKLVERILEHVRKEHPNEENYIRELEEELVELDNAFMEDMYLP